MSAVLSGCFFLRDRGARAAGHHAGSPKARTESDADTPRISRQEIDMNTISDWIQEPRTRRARRGASRRRRGRRRPRRAWRRRSPRRATARSVTLLERYNHLGGLASGGMVLVLDDMWDSHLQRDLGARHLHRDDRAHGRARPGRRSRAQHEWGDAARVACGAGRAGARSTSTARRSRTRSASPPPSIRTASSASSLEMVAAGRHQAAPAFVVLAHAGRGRRRSRAWSARPRAAARRSSATS